MADSDRPPQLIAQAEGSVWPQLAIAMVLMCLSAYLPLALIAAKAMGPQNPSAVLLSLAADPLYEHSLIATLSISASVAIGSALLGATLAIFMAHTATRTETILLVLTVSSLWMSVLLRSFIWIVLLGNRGWILPKLIALGLVQKGGTILFTPTAVIIAMVHVLMPISVLTIWTQLRSDARRNRQIAQSLGATDAFYSVWVLFARVGRVSIVAAAITFVMAAGFYITPALLGGGNGSTQMLGILIEQQIDLFGDWQKASMIAVLLLISIISILAAASLLSRRSGRL